MCLIGWIDTLCYNVICLVIAYWIKQNWMNSHIAPSSIYILAFCNMWTSSIYRSPPLCTIIYILLKSTIQVCCQVSLIAMWSKISPADFFFTSTLFTFFLNVNPRRQAIPSTTTYEIKISLNISANNSAIENEIDRGSWYLTAISRQLMGVTNISLED